ncbi:MAG: hypothetical protein PHO26_06870 [Dehalococcoidia bacterium]|nr:hypothetical protein [Dehalococcoidia bacterium]MDD5495445.1 hypothetical protein [Dehalococcoidia bacterium]
MSDSDRTRLISSLEIVTGVGLLLYWLAFYLVGMAPDNPPSGYFAHANALAIPECLLGTLLLIAGIFLMMDKPLGWKLSPVAAGALTVVGLVHICFNLQNGVYLSSEIDLAINAVKDAWCAGFGIALAVMVIRK